MKQGSAANLESSTIFIGILFRHFAPCELNKFYPPSQTKSLLVSSSSHSEDMLIKLLSFMRLFIHALREALEILNFSFERSIYYRSWLYLL